MKFRHACNCAAASSTVARALQPLARATCLRNQSSPGWAVRHARDRDEREPACRRSDAPLLRQRLRGTAGPGGFKRSFRSTPSHSIHCTAHRGRVRMRSWSGVRAGRVRTESRRGVLPCKRASAGKLHLHPADPQFSRSDVWSGAKPVHFSTRSHVRVSRGAPAARYIPSCRYNTPRPRRRPRPRHRARTSRRHGGGAGTVARSLRVPVLAR